MKRTFETDSYFSSIPQKRSATMFVLREMIFEVFPDVLENIYQGKPTYTLKGRTLCSLANHTEFMAFHFTPFDLLLEFEYELEAYDWHRTHIRFTKIKEEDFNLFEKILRFAGNNYHKSGAFRRVPVQQNVAETMEV